MKRDLLPVEETEDGVSDSMSFWELEYLPGVGGPGRWYVVCNHNIELVSNPISHYLLSTSA